MKIILVRHGQVPHNVKRIFTMDDESLTKEGVKQAQEVSAKLKDYYFDGVFCSPLKRCRETCFYIVGKRDDIQYVNDLKERDETGLTGIHADDISIPNYWNYYRHDYDDKSENIKAFFARIYAFIDELKTEDYHCVLVVAHSGVSKAFRAYFEGMGDGCFYKKGLKNAEFWEFELKK